MSLASINDIAPPIPLSWITPHLHHRITEAHPRVMLQLQKLAFSPSHIHCGDTGHIPPFSTNTGISLGIQRRATAVVTLTWCRRHLSEGGRMMRHFSMVC